MGSCARLAASTLLLLTVGPSWAATVINGSSGADTIDGSGLAGPLEIYGNGGSDTINGSVAADWIDGGPNNDQIDGGAGDDVIVGQSGRDVLNGGSGNDTFTYAGCRNYYDDVSGGPGTDTIAGSSSDDCIGLRLLADVDHIAGGQGSDTIQKDPNSLMLDLSGVLITSVELIVGGSGRDLIIGSATDDIIAGGNGNDDLQGGAGRDVAVFAGPSSNFSIEVEGTMLVIRDHVGRVGTDRISGFEFLRFDDGEYNTFTWLPDPGNRSPTARSDEATVSEDGVVEIEVLANDSDPDGDSLTVTSVRPPTTGSAVVSAGRAVVYTPPADYFGDAKFEYTISDGRNGSASATVVVFVMGRPDSPVARPDSASTPVGIPVAIPVLENDSDVDGDTLSLSNVLPPTPSGSVRISGSEAVFSPAAGFTGIAKFDYEVSDGAGRFARATVTVAVTGTGPPPSPQSELLERLGAAAEGSWIRVNKNEFRDVWPALDQIPNTPGYLKPSKVIFAWGSMAWDSNRDQLIFWGGGHANYSGNEVYRFDTKTLRWERASLPSDMVNPLGDSQYFAVDGPLNAPTSSHTYDNQEFLPLIDRFLTFGGAKFNGKQKFVLQDGVTLTGPYLWDPSRAGADLVGGASGSQVNPQLYPDVIGTRMWDNRDTIRRKGIGSVRPSGDFVNSTSAYHRFEGQDAVFITDSPRAGGELYRYILPESGDSGADRWELVGTDGVGYGNQGAGAFDPQRQLYARTANTFAGWGLVVWNTATPSQSNRSYVVMPATSDPAFRITHLHGMDFDQRRGKFLLWDGGPDLWYVTPPSSASSSGWTVERAPIANPAGAPRQEDASLLSYSGTLTEQRGVLGKWKYAPDLDVFLGVVAPETGDVWVYKPAGWEPPSN
jgi:hypothetical protein